MCVCVCVEVNYEINISTTDQNFNFNVTTRLVHIHNKRLRQFFKASVISLSSSVNTHSRFFNLSLFLGKLGLNSYNIRNFNFLS